jgi:hypothetical protein
MAATPSLTTLARTGPGRQAYAQADRAFADPASVPDALAAINAIPVPADAAALGEVRDAAKMVSRLGGD